MKLLRFQLLCVWKKSLAKKRNMRRRRLKLLVPARRNSVPIYIPLDLQINILLRLPVKSILRFRCVSKLWSSITRSQDFKNQHLNITASSSSPVPRILISFKISNNYILLVVSSPNPNPNPNPNPKASSSSTSYVVPYKDLDLLKIRGTNVQNPIRGLVCVQSLIKVGICNPSTKQLHVFRQVRFKQHNGDYFFGYDPIEDQYKILEGKKIVVLGREQAWREAPSFPHIAHTRGLYMNGTIYYGASRTDIHSPNNKSIIVSFDVRSETFNAIKVPEVHKKIWLPDPWRPTDKTLINYEGKLGVVEKPGSDGSFRLWVVEDAAKEEWSMNTFHLPQPFAGLDFFNVMDTTFYNDEICLVPKNLPDPFRLFFYNLKRNTMRSVVIEGLPISELKRVNKLSVTVSDHCESIMSLKETKKHRELQVIIKGESPLMKHLRYR